MNTSGPKCLQCPNCGGPVSFQAPFCPYCRGPLTWTATLPLERGTPLAYADVSRDPMPVADPQRVLTTPKRIAEGVEISLPKDQAMDEQFAPKLCDACVAVTAAVFDKNGAVGVTARMHDFGDHSSGYNLMVQPGYRTFRVTRVIITKTKTFTEGVQPWEVAPSLGGPGVMNHIELRCGDAVLQVLLNGVRAAAFVDASLGYGRFGWRVHGYDGPTRAVFRTVELYRIV